MNTTKFFLSTLVAAAAMTANAFAESTIIEVVPNETTMEGIYTNDTTFKFSGDYIATTNPGITLNGGNVTLDADNEVLITQETNWTIATSGVAGTFTIGRNITIDAVEDKNISLNVSGGSSLVVEGKISRKSMGALNLTDGDHRVTSTGTIATESLSIKSSKSETYYLPHATLTVDGGDIGVHQSLSMEGGELKAINNASVKSGIKIELLYGSVMDITDSTVETYALINNEGYSIPANSDLGIPESVTIQASSIKLTNSSLSANHIANAQNSGSFEMDGIALGDYLAATITLVDSTLTAKTIDNTHGTITVYGDSTINAGSIIGNKIIVTEGATLTIASSLLDMVDNSANATGGNVVFGSVDSAVSLTANEALTVIVAETGSVQLSTAASDIVVSKAAALDVAEVAGIDGNVVAAWDFEIANNEEAVEVSTTIASGLSKEDIKIFHKADDSTAWTDETESVNVNYDATTGKLSFTTNSFSSYAVAAPIPEPSTFGLLAGLGALALVGARRRRR